MKKKLIACSFLVALLLVGCKTGTQQPLTTPLAVSGPVTVSGPVNVTGPINVSGQAPAGQATVRSVGAAAVTPSATISTTAATVVDSGAVLELKKETAGATKTTVSNGQVVIRKTVVTENVSVPVTTRREEYTVEEVPTDAAPTTPWGTGEAVIQIPLTKESATIAITPRVYKVIRVNKTATTDQGAVTGAVRTENVEVVKQQPLP